jgi:hypothetical protein
MEGAVPKAPTAQKTETTTVSRRSLRSPSIAFRFNEYAMNSISVTGHSSETP